VAAVIWTRLKQKLIERKKDSSFISVQLIFSKGLLVFWDFLTKLSKNKFRQFTNTHSKNVAGDD
jgi:hypothetical protein